MATRTLKTTGGPYTWDTTSATPWQEGAAPVAGDTVIIGAAEDVTVSEEVGGTGFETLDLSGRTGGTLAHGIYKINVAPASSGTALTLPTAAGYAVTGTGGFRLLASGTLVANGRTWPTNLDFGQAGSTSLTATLSDAWVVTGGLWFQASTGITLNGSTMSVAGGFYNKQGTTGGTTVVTITGGTLTREAGAIAVSLTLNGDITFNAGYQINYQTGTLKYQSGTITHNGKTLQLSAPVTIDTTGFTWPTVVLSGNGNYTINSLLSATTLSNAGASNPACIGTAGFTVGTLTLTNPTTSTIRTFGLKNGNTYTVTTALNIGGTDASRHWRIQAPTTATAALTVQTGASQTVDLNTEGYYIDSSGGDTIYTNGSKTGCVNWEAPPAGATPNTMRNVYTQAVHRAASW